MRAALIGWAVGAASFFAGCAQVRELQGGEKDGTAPVLLEALPASGTTRFVGTRILLRFDERVKLDRVQERILISPPLEPAPEVVLGRSDEVVIELKGPLAPNTTYVFNVGDAVVDITEGNAAAGLAYVLSTGDHVDSASVSGALVDAFAGKPLPKTLVMAYFEGDTARPLLGRPAFFTRTDAAGGFRIPYMRRGRYRIAALNDKNANYRYDLPNEDIAFSDSAITTDDGRSQVLRMFRERPTTQQLLEMRVMDDRNWRLVLAMASKQLAIRQLDRADDPLTWYQEWNVTRDTVQLWPSDTTLLVGQRFALSENEVVFDTITYRPSKRMPFNVVLERSGIVEQVELHATRPLANIDTSRIELRSDSLRAPFTGSIDPSEPRTVQGLGGDERPRTLLLLPGAVTDIYKGTNDTLRFTWGEALPDRTGKLLLRLLADSAWTVRGPFVLQLISAQGSVVKEVQLEDLPASDIPLVLSAGELSIKLIADRDGDGRWSTGHLPVGLQPEQVFLYPSKVALRSGWELEVEWLLTP